MFWTKNNSRNTSTVQCFCKCEKKRRHFERTTYYILHLPNVVVFVFMFAVVCHRMSNIEYKNQTSIFQLTLNFVMFCIGKQFVFILGVHTIYILKWKYLWIDSNESELKFSGFTFDSIFYSLYWEIDLFIGYMIWQLKIEILFFLSFSFGKILSIQAENNFFMGWKWFFTVYFENIPNKILSKQH